MTLYTQLVLDVYLMTLTCWPMYDTQCMASAQLGSELACKTNHQLVNYDHTKFTHMLCRIDSLFYVSLILTVMIDF